MRVGGSGDGRGETSCFQAKGPAGCMHPVVQHSRGVDVGKRRSHLIGTPGQFKRPHHGTVFYLLSIRDPLIQETNPLNQTGLSCKAWLGMPLSGSHLPAGVNGLWCRILTPSYPTTQASVRLRAAEYHALS